MRFREFMILLESLDPETRRNRKEMVKHFANLSRYSKWNAEHSMEVARLARDFAKHLGLDFNKVAISALSHDVGKVKIPKDVLHKPGKLGDTERKVMDAHSLASSTILKSLTGEHGKLARLAADYHHTKPIKLDQMATDGHLSEDEVLFIKLITICDIFEALTSNKRPYKEAKPKIESLELMANIDIIDQELFKSFEKWQRSEFANEYRVKP